MADLNINQINKNLLDIFDDEDRVIVFWYDSLSEFKDSIPNLDLGDIKIHYLREDNLFETKVLLEYLDKENNYLVYAPFSMPSDNENYLVDIIKYNKLFSADKTALILTEMDLNLDYKYVLDTHRDFFNSNEYTNRFMQYSYLNPSEDEFIKGMLCSIINLPYLDFDVLVSSLISMSNDESTRILNTFERLKLTDNFWEIIEKEYLYIDEDKSLDRFINGLFVSYSNFENEGNKIFKELSYEVNNYSRVRQLFENKLTDTQINFMSQNVSEHFGGKEYFSRFEVESISKLRLFSEIDDLLISWILNNIKIGHYNITLNNFDLIELCNYRNAGLLKRFNEEYNLLIDVVTFLRLKNIENYNNFKDVINAYTSKYYKIDMMYRNIINKYNKLSNSEKYEEIINIVEYEYTNNYLNKLIPNYVEVFDYKSLERNNRQRSFYDQHVHYETVKTAVIISDAFRFEVGKDLFNQLKNDVKYDVDINYMLTSLPSTTNVGMAALLPHNELSLTDSYEVLIDDKKTSSLSYRKNILQSTSESAVAIQYNDFERMLASERREFTTGKSKIYIYHNQIDAIGDDVKTEHQVFLATENAIDDLKKLIRLLADQLSITNIIITSDHGFIYTRSSNEEFEKIEKFYDDKDNINRRFVLSTKSYEKIGIRKFSLKEEFNINSKYNAYVPLSYLVFKMSGGGQNYYHGGLSPQENIVPLIKIKAARGKIETERTKINLLYPITRITSLIVKVDIVQVSPVKDNVVENNFDLYFKDKDGNKISNTINFVANMTAEDSKSRIKSFTFNLESKQYNSLQNYYFVVEEINSKYEIISQAVTIDIAFADDFGF